MKCSVTYVSNSASQESTNHRTVLKDLVTKNEPTDAVNDKLPKWKKWNLVQVWQTGQQLFEGHLNPRLFNPRLQPRTFQCQIFQPWTFQPRTFQPWIFNHAIFSILIYHILDRKTFYSLDISSFACSLII